MTDSQAAGLLLILGPALTFLILFILEARFREVFIFLGVIGALLIASVAMTVGWTLLTGGGS